VNESTLANMTDGIVKYIDFLADQTVYRKSIRAIHEYKNILDRITEASWAELVNHANFWPSMKTKV
jgi:hypothetical protein